VEVDLAFHLPPLAVAGSESLFTLPFCMLIEDSLRQDRRESQCSALEAKLAKYEQIKQGIMQELLTGRRGWFDLFECRTEIISCFILVFMDNLK